jgi:hypothetical protein
MDALTLVEHLTPYLPVLLKFGEETGKAIAKRIGEDGWQKAKEQAAVLWERIHPKAKEDIKLMEAAQEIAKAQEALSVLPEGTDQKLVSEELADYQRIFARRLKPLLDIHPELTTLAETTIEQMIRIEGEAGNIRQNVKREGNVRQGVQVGPSGKAGDIEQEA